MLLDKTLKKPSTASLYWQCQLMGWGVVALYWAYVVFSRDNYGVFYTVLNYFFDVFVGIVLTHLYRRIALRKKWSELPLKKLLLRVVPSMILLGALFMFFNNFKWYVYWVCITGDDYVLWKTLLYWNPVLITGFRLMSIWILAYHLYHYYLRELNTAKENAQLSIIAKQAQLDNLSAQLNPHFLFNSLNSIKSLIVENPKIARRAVDLLSDLLRSSLYGNSEKLITIKEELFLVNDYIELEKMRFEERLKVKVVCEESLKKYKIPALSIQSLVENAIKHGIDKRVEGGLVEISIRLGEGSLKIEVTNPGTLNLEERKGLGLANLRQRLQLQFKGNASYHIKADANEKVIATLLIPLQ